MDIEDIEATQSPNQGEHELIEDGNNSSGNSGKSMSDYEEKDDIDSLDDDYIQFPRVNCPEKIILCIDASSEMNKLSFKSKSGDKFAPLKLIKRALGLFLETKSKISNKHEYSLIIMQDKAYWVCDFTKNPKDIIKFLDERCNTMDCDTFDLSSLFNVIKDHVELPTVDGDSTILPPPYIVRTILIYGRSEGEILFTDQEAQKYLEGSPYFFLDAFYVHEPLSEDNKCEETFNKLCALDLKGLSYILETSRNPTKLHVFMGQLLSHPLQRPLQSDVSYTIPVS